MQVLPAISRWDQSVMPNADSALLMSHIDALKPEWRALVHEYGYKAVMGCLEDRKSLHDAEDHLWMQRNSRQAEWLATNYITKRSFARYV